MSKSKSDSGIDWARHLMPPASLGELLAVGLIGVALWYLSHLA
jgi:hypothetical protein